MKFLILSFFSVFFIQAALADGGTTTIDLSPDILKTSKSKISLETQFGTVQIKTSDLRNLMSEKTNRSTIGDLLAGLSVNENDFTIQQSQNIKVSGVPADYTAEVLTLTSGDFSKLGHGSKTVDSSSVKTTHLLIIDCQCE